jgi:hypothetical protein
VDVGQHVVLVVRHHGLEGFAGAQLLATDHRADLDAVAPQLVEASLQRSAFR